MQKINFSIILKKKRTLFIFLLFIAPNVLANQCIYVIHSQCPVNTDYQINTEFIFIFSSTSITNDKNKICRNKASINQAATMHFNNKNGKGSYCLDEDGYHFAYNLDIKSTEIFFPSNILDNVTTAINRGHFLIDKCTESKPSAKCVSNIVNKEFSIDNLDLYLKKQK